MGNVTVSKRVCVKGAEMGFSGLSAHWISVLGAWKKDIIRDFFLVNLRARARENSSKIGSGL
jgi:hypothetical protein